MSICGHLSEMLRSGATTTGPILNVVFRTCKTLGVWKGLSPQKLKLNPIKMSTWFDCRSSNVRGRHAIVLSTLLSCCPKVRNLEEVKLTFQVAEFVRCIYPKSFTMCLSFTDGCKLLTIGSHRRPVLANSLTTDCFVVESKFR